MKYRTIRQVVAMSQSSKKPADIANDEYQLRLSSPSTYRSGIIFHDYELFAMCITDLVTRMNDIVDTEKFIEKAWSKLPRFAQREYLMQLIAKEMQNTNSIEGVHSTRKELTKALEAAEDQKKHTRFSEFAKLFLELADSDEHNTSLPQNLADIRTIYDRIMLDELDAKDAPDGEIFRTGQVNICDATGNVIHQGDVTEAEIQKHLTDMLRFMNNDEVPSLIKACMCHYAFESTHPFYDGNGRTGRFLLALQLHEQLSMPTILSLSSMIDAEKFGYYSAFSKVQEVFNCNDLTMFCYTMLEYIQKAQSDVADNITVQLKQMMYCLDKLRALSKEMVISSIQAEVLAILMQNKLFSYDPKPMTRQQLRNYVGDALDEKIGERKMLTALNGLHENGMIACEGMRPALYTLSEKSLAMFS